MATFAPKPGQMLSGLKGTYAVSKQINGTIWNAARNSDLLATVLKTAPVFRLRREQNILERFQNHPTIRQLIDYIEDPPCLVLEHLESDGLQCSGEAKLSRPDIKLIAKSVLGALKSLHEMDIAHTDVKPDNVLLNFHKDGTGVAEAKLADCGDAWDVSYDTNPKGKGHIIGATIFRSPEAILSHRWSTPTDIWSFGATLISLIWGKHFHIFKPPPDAETSPDDEEFWMHVLVQQVRYFGPWPPSYTDFISEEEEQFLSGTMQYVHEKGWRKPFELLQDKEVTLADKMFISKMMQMDPRDRPTAKVLLEDEWFDHP